jgi:hypothetical protein
MSPSKTTTTTTNDNRGIILPGDETQIFGKFYWLPPGSFYFLTMRQGLASLFA